MARFWPVSLPVSYAGKTLIWLDFVELFEKLCTSMCL